MELLHSALCERGDFPCGDFDQKCKRDGEHGVRCSSGSPHVFEACEGIVDECSFVHRVADGWDASDFEACDIQHSRAIGKPHFFPVHTEVRGELAAVGPPVAVLSHCGSGKKYRNCVLSAAKTPGSSIVVPEARSLSALRCGDTLQTPRMIHAG